MSDRHLTLSEVEVVAAAPYGLGMTQPWPGETMPLPSRVDGKRIVAAIKVPTRNVELNASGIARVRPHQWEVVLEWSAGLFSELRLVYRAGKFESHSEVVGLSYEDAVLRMIGRTGMVK